MVFKKFIVLLLALVLFSALAPVTAQEDSAWGVYFFDYASTSVIKVNPDGTSETFPLVFAEGEFLNSQIALAGNMVAYCTNTATADGLPLNRFYVRDFVTGTDMIALELPYDSCNVTDAAFSPDASMVAFGAGNFYNPDVAQEWHLLVYDVATGELGQDLAELPEGSATLGVPMPAPRAWDENGLSFAMLMWGTGGAPTYPAFTWNMNDGSIVEAPQWGTYFADFDPLTGDWVVLTLDETRAAGNPGGPVPGNNVVELISADGTETELYYSDTMIPINVKFIEDGNAIAVQLLEAFDPALGEGMQGTTWMRIDRTGETTELYGKTLEFSLLDGIPGGHFAGFFHSPTGDTPGSFEVWQVTNAGAVSVTLPLTQPPVYLGVQ